MNRALLTTLVAGAVVTVLAGCTAAGAPGAMTQTFTPVPSAGPLGQSDGYVPEGSTVKLTDDVPAITRLDGQLKDALTKAAASAASKHITFTFTDAWRSARYQQFLFNKAVITYGSAAEATKWAKPANKSMHVEGKAVDIATADAMDWLTRFGAPFGLCQIYANEIWHYEYRADAAAAGTCPPQLADGSVHR